MNHPNEPTNSDSPWEEAMSRDFDARVRGLHEEPLDFTSVKGKARKIRRNRRAAVAGGILGIAAIVTPIAVLSNGGSTETKEPPFVVDPSETIVDPNAQVVDYIAGDVWHQADGDTVKLPDGDYYNAAIWDDQLVTIQPWGEVYSKIDIFDESGELVGSIEEANGIAVSADGTILSYVTAGGKLIARWDGGESELAQDVTESGGGESVGGAPTSVIGTAPCEPESGACLVRVNTDFACNGYGSSDVPLPSDAQRCFDEQDGLLSYTNEIRDDGVTCGGVWSGVKSDFLWHNCKFQAQDISPDGQYVVGAPSQYDGLGYREISILDAQSGIETGRYAPEGQASFIWSEVAWTTANTLLLSTYDGANWQLIELAPDGEITEIGDPVPGEDFDSSYLLIRH
jgi:hypothetical protein